MSHRCFWIIALFSFMILPTFSQDSPFTPAITVDDQIITESHVVINEVVSQRFGFVIIRADDGTGQAGGVIGLALIRPGSNQNIRIELEMINLTPTLHAIVHVDSEPFGQFQFGEVDGADMPVMVDDATVQQTFDIIAVSSHDQFIDADNFNRVLVDTASTQEDAWLVAHNDNNGALGDVIGQTFLEAGTSQHIPVLLSGSTTDDIHLVLHADSGDLERFDYGETETSDLPLTVNQVIAKTIIRTVPTLRVDPQLVIGSDLTRNSNEFVPFVVDGVLSEGAGWLVVHADDGTGMAGDILGIAPVQNGFNDNVIIELPQTDITPQLFPMLHEDTGTALVYEFGDVDDVDLPTTYNGEIIMGSASVIPSIGSVTWHDNTLQVNNVITDTAGWLVAYAGDDTSADNTSADILAYAPINMGVNAMIDLTVANMPSIAYITLQLHYDTRPPGIFGVTDNDGSDLPVVFDGEPITITIDLETD